MKRATKYFALAFAVAIILPVVASCGKLSNSVKIDKTKSQLYIGNYDGGMGSRWLDEYIDGFEAKYAEVSFEEGKTGVEVIPLNDKVLYDPDNISQTISKSTVNVFFTERLEYYELVERGVLYDITSAVQETLEGEERSIEDKLSEAQKEYYAKDGKYYGLPHYQTFRGIVYDIDLFNSKKLYIKADGTINGQSEDKDLSAGPDGETGTYDDGLPATYDEFFEWCDYVKTFKSVTPICWTGAYKETYTEHLIDALYVTAQGYNGAQSRYDLGEGETVTAKIISGFENGEPEIVTADISRDNYKQITKHKGLYNALDFFERLMAGNYYYPMSLNTTQTHELTHYDFLHSRFEPQNYTPIAMMIEGTWWEEESNLIFEDMAMDYDGAARSERNFGFLPLPKPTEEELGKPVLYDGNRAIVVVNGNCDSVKADIATKFIKYISSDANLQRFTQITGISRDYDYTLKEEQQNTLSAFAKSIYNLSSNNAGIVYGYPLSYDNYLWKLVNSLPMYKSNVDGEIINYPVSAFSNGKVTAEQYFLGVAKNAGI